MLVQDLHVVVVGVGVAVQSDALPFPPRAAALVTATFPFDVASPPVAVDEAPGTINTDSCPRVSGK